MTVTTFYGNPAHDCGGAQVRARCRQLATVVTISGAIDDSNVDGITDYAKHFVLAEKPFVLDLSGVSSFAAHGISLLDSLADDCDAIGVEWRLIASEPVVRTVSACADPAAIPAAGSVPDALGEFAELTRSRRRLLPILTKTA